MMATLCSPGRARAELCDGTWKHRYVSCKADGACHGSICLGEEVTARLQLLLQTRQQETRQRQQRNYSTAGRHNWSGSGRISCRPQEVHVLFAANKMEPRVMGVRAGLGDMNTFKYAGQNLDVSVESMNAGRAVVVVKSFKNAAAAKAYVAQFRYAPQLVREFNANKYQTLIISASNFRKLMADRGLGSYLPFYRAHY